MSESLAAIVARAAATSRAEAAKTPERARICADVLDQLPELIRAARHARGLTRHAAAKQAGVEESTWQAAEYGRRAGTVKTLVPILRWLADEDAVA